MKKTICTFLVIFAAFAAFSQSMPQVDGVPLVTAQDYRTAENVVVQVDGNLLSTPIDKANETRLYAGIFLVRWINGRLISISPSSKAAEIFKKRCRPHQRVLCRLIIICP